MFSTLRFIFFLIAFASILSSSQSSDHVDSEYFVSSLTKAMSVIGEVVQNISLFSKFSNDSRPSKAISDCVDLLHFSSYVLNWSVSAIQNPNGEDYGSGDLTSDLNTWLSATLANLDTCVDGFDGTNVTAETVLGNNSLNDITSSVHDLLTKLQSSSNKSIVQNGQLSPTWFKRKLLMADKGTANVTVAKDGTGNFTKIMDAVLAAPNVSLVRYVIYIKTGVYNEYVEIDKNKWNIMMVGDGTNSTIITGNRNVVDGWTTYRTGTFIVNGRGFIARDITFENTAGPGKHQAVAIRSDSDLSVFYRCDIRGYQDTLYAHSMRQFYRECKIRGTVDFIFGDGTVVFQNCEILMRKGLPGQKNTVTAQGRTDPHRTTGFSIHLCNITADTDLVGSTNTTRSYLGRPWKSYSRTVVMQSYISDAIRPEGWLEFNGSFGLDTLEFGEYVNNGPGSRLLGRVKWPGYRVMDLGSAGQFTVANFIKGNGWLPRTGVNYTGGLAVYFFVRSCRM